MITSHIARSFVMAEKIKKARNVLPIERKYNVLQEILSGISKKSVAKKYGVPKSTVSTWLANKDKILAAYESGEINPKRQKRKRAENEDLDKAVYTWFQNTRANNVPVSGVVLRKKALQFVKPLHLDEPLMVGLIGGNLGTMSLLERFPGKRNHVLLKWLHPGKRLICQLFFPDRTFSTLMNSVFSIRRFHQNQCASETNDVQEEIQ